MKRTATFVLKVLAGLVLLVLAGVVFVLVFNRFDEKLTPEAQALLAPRAVAGNPQTNAYFVLLGMRAPAGQDALAAGIALDKLYLDAYVKTPMLAEAPEAQAALGGPEIELQRDAALRCNWFEKDCAAQFRSQRAAIETFGAAQALLFERYQRALALPEYHDRALQSLQEPVTPLLLFLDMDALAQARAVFACDRGDAAGAMVHVRRITTTARRVMANTASLATKVVFAQVLRNNLALLNALVRDCPALVAQQAPALTEVALPLTAAELGLERQVDAEVGIVARNFMFRDSVYDLTFNTDGGSTGSRLIGTLMDGLYKPNATANFLASRRPFFSVDSHWQRGQRGQDEKSANPHTQWPSGSFWRDYVDNPAGRIMVLIATPNLGVYADRLLDIDGYLRLTALHLMVRTVEVDEDAIGEFVIAQAIRYGDPYNGRPMAWDAAQRQLSFQGHGRPSSSGPADGRFTIALGRRP